MNRTIAIALLTACWITANAMACGADGGNGNDAANGNNANGQNGQNGQKAVAAKQVKDAGQKKVEGSERLATAGGAVNDNGRLTPAKQAAGGNAAAGADDGSCPN